MNFLLFICMTVGFIFAIFIILKLLTIIFDNIKYSKLKKIIQRNPYIGTKDRDNNFLYTQGKFTLNYRIIPSKINEAKNRIELIYGKRRLRSYEKEFLRFSKSIDDFFIHRKWMYFLEPKIFISLLSLILIFYFVLFEPQHYKINRLRGTISFLLRVNPENVEVKPDGWVKISGSRTTAADYQVEPVNFNVNLFDWLTFQDDGNITRWRGRPYGYVDYPLKYDEQGNIWIEKEGEWITGTIKRNRIDWEEPQGTGIRAGRVLGHQLNLKEEFSLPDK